MTTSKLGRYLYVCARLGLGLRQVPKSCRGLGPGPVAWRKQLPLSSVALTSRNYSSESGALLPETEEPGFGFNCPNRKENKAFTSPLWFPTFQDKLGEVVFVELPEVGRELSKGDLFSVLESVKAAADILSPMSGTVTEVNSELTEEPDLINKEPFGRGWVIKLEVSDKSEYDELMSQEDYDKHISDGT